MELMMAISALIILLSVALPAYQRSAQHARETVLKENLWQIRRQIDQHSADKEKTAAALERACRG
ncbi:MAG: type II secretion system protein [Acidobacteria bacterium]|nr:type II secretion system protein [Acidobacteriota bacterium]